MCAFEHELQCISEHLKHLNLFNVVKPSRASTMAASDKERVRQYRERVQLQQCNDGSKKAYGDDDDWGEADHGLETLCPDGLMTAPARASSSWTNRWQDSEEKQVDAHGPSHGASDEADDDDDDDDDPWQEESGVSLGISTSTHSLLGHALSCEVCCCRDFEV